MIMVVHNNNSIYIFEKLFAYSLRHDSTEMTSLFVIGMYISD